jgi:hypothetical protein
MALKDYEPPRRAVSYRVGGDGTADLNLRALSVRDITTLTNAFRPQVERALRLYNLSVAEGEDNAADMFLFRVASDITELSAAVIAEAIDEPDSVEQAAQLPAAVQVEALSVIIELTLGDVGSVKNLLAVVGKALQPPPLTDRN